VATVEGTNNSETLDAVDDVTNDGDTMLVGTASDTYYVDNAGDADRAYVAQRALMSYGPDPYDNFRRSASYADRILKGATPADLPVQQPVKFELAINLKTARALGLQIPEKLLALVDEMMASPAS
jgi:hypothetical protein